MRKISIIRLYWGLLVILPFMDTFNGFLNNGGNEGGMSIGIIYRIVILFFALVLLIKNGIKKRQALILITIMAVITISAIIGSAHITAYINHIFRLLLTIIMVISFESIYKKVDKSFCYSIFRYWSILFPLTIEVPYLLGLGFNTYGVGAAGYKGFYFAQNDIGYILAVLYLFVIFELSDKFTIRNLIVLLALLIANIMLGLKSNYILAAASTVGFLFIKSKKHKPQFSKIFVILAVAMGLIIVMRVYSDEISQITTRWNYFYNNRDFLSFITSARSDRIIPAYNWIDKNLGVAGLLFGSGSEYTFHTVSVGNNIIEMDAFDIVFQIGLVGLFLIYGFYFSILKKYRFKRFYFWAFLFSIIIGASAGHVLESALSGMFFALVCCGGINSSRGEIV